MTLKKYKIMVQLDSSKDAELVGAKEGYGDVIINDYTEDLYRNKKVQLTLPTLQTFLGAVMKSISYSRIGIINRIVRVNNTKKT